MNDNPGGILRSGWRHDMAEAGIQPSKAKDGRPQLAPEPFADSRGEHLDQPIKCRAVIVRGTPPPDGSRSPPEVLNAFRRHRQGHAMETGVFDNRKQCSTPFGVIVRGT
jgi:hypothetical protein